MSKTLKNVEQSLHAFTTFEDVFIIHKDPSVRQKIFSLLCCEIGFCTVSPQPSKAKQSCVHALTEWTIRLDPCQENIKQYY